MADDNKTMNSAQAEKQLSNLPVFPDSLSEFSVLDKKEMIVYIDRKSSGDPLFLTWITRCKRLSFAWEVKVADLDQIADMRSKGMNTAVSDQSEDISEEVKGRAIDLLRMAAKYKASDIHILVRASMGEIQFRVKGGLKVYRRLSKSESISLVRSLYQGVASIRDSSYNELESQNAQISGEVVSDMKVTSVRMVRGPAYPIESGGSFAVLRMQYMEGHKAEKGLRKLEEPRRPEGSLMLGAMGMTPLQISLLLRMSEAPSGIIMFTGPTGSGKTTSLAQMLTHVARKWPDKRQVTIEDPVEYPYSWAVQLVITNSTSEEATGDAFADKLRTALRMDPDIVLMGELRGAESTIAALNAALTGHQVWTTLHVNDPFSSIDRMELMDPVRLNRKITCDYKSLRGIIAQRLLPRLCPYCSIPHEDHRPESIEETEDKNRIMSILSSYGDTAAVKFQGKGCEHCDYDGISGMAAVAEVVETSATLMRDFIQHGTDTARRNHRAKEDTDHSMMENSVMLVLGGFIDPREINKRVDQLVPKGMEDN